MWEEVGRKPSRSQISPLRPVATGLLVDIHVDLCMWPCETESTAVFSNQCPHVAHATYSPTFLSTLRNVLATFLHPRLESQSTFSRGCPARDEPPDPPGAPLGEEVPWCAQFPTRRPDADLGCGVFIWFLAVVALQRIPCPLCVSVSLPQTWRFMGFSGPGHRRDSGLCVNPRDEYHFLFQARCPVHPG